MQQAKRGHLLRIRHQRKEEEHEPRAKSIALARDTPKAPARQQRLRRRAAQGEGLRSGNDHAARFFNAGGETARSKEAARASGESTPHPYEGSARKKSA